MRRNELFFVILAVVVLLFISYWPVVENFGTTPPDRYYFGESEYPLDMLGNLSYVQQGYHGNLLAQFNYSTLLGGHPSIVKTEYVLVGLVGRLLNISPLPMFAISRFVISLLVISVIYLLIAYCFSESWQRIISFFFVLFGTGISLLGAPNALVESGGSDIQVLHRLTQAMHHYLLGAGAILLSLYFLSRSLEIPKNRLVFIFSLIFGMASSLLYAPNTVLLLSGFPLYILLDAVQSYIKTKSVRFDLLKIGVLFAYSVVVLVPLVYVRYVTTYVWNDIRTAHMESLFPFYIPPHEYVMVVGVLYVLSLISIPWIIRRGKPIALLLATWLVMHPVGEYVISPLLHINNIRYFLTPYYVAFGTLPVFGLVALFKRMNAGIATILVILVLSTSIGTYAAAWEREHACFCVAAPLDFAYPKKSVMEGIFWLSKNTKPDDIVLSGYFSGVLIGAFSGNRVYVSWWYRLIEPPTIHRVEANFIRFYRGELSAKDAYAYLQQGRIAYVFYAEPEQAYAPGKMTLDYPFLIERYSKDGTRIYKVH